MTQSRRKLAESVLKALEQEEESLEYILMQEPGSITDPELIEAKLEKLSMRISRAQQAVRALGGRVT